MDPYERSLYPITWRIPTIIELAQLIVYNREGGPNYLDGHYIPTLLDRGIWSSSVSGNEVWVLLIRTLITNKIKFSKALTKNVIIFVYSTKHHLWWSAYFPQDTYENMEKLRKEGKITWSFATPKITT